MQPRLEYAKASPEAAKAMIQLESVVRRSGIDPHLLELIKIRASPLNGCAYCIDMHTKDARAKGETEQRIYALNAWRVTPFFSDKERANCLESDCHRVSLRSGQLSAGYALIHGDRRWPAALFKSRQ